MAEGITDTGAGVEVQPETTSPIDETLVGGAAEDNAEVAEGTDGDNADDLFANIAVIEKCLVANLHGFHEIADLVVADAFPRTGLVSGQVVDTIGGRFAFHEPILHRCTPIIYLSQVCR